MLLATWGASVQELQVHYKVQKIFLLCGLQNLRRLGGEALLIPANASAASVRETITQARSFARWGSSLGHS